MISLICGIQKHDTNDLIYKTDLESKVMVITKEEWERDKLAG